MNATLTSNVSEANRGAFGRRPLQPGAEATKSPKSAESPELRRLCRLSRLSGDQPQPLFCQLNWDFQQNISVVFVSLVQNIQ